MSMLQRLANMGGKAEKTYIEDVFSTHLYTGAQTINNGIDLSGKGGLVWLKGRSGASDHVLADTARGSNYYLSSNNTAAQSNLTNAVIFNSNGFTPEAFYGSQTVASWTFRKAPKFFDVVTYTGNGTDNRAISHNLGIEPGFITIKRTDNSSSWRSFHRGIGTGAYIQLNTTSAASGPYQWAFPNVTATTFTPSSSEFDFAMNVSGATYVAYLFAHDTSTDGLIQCGSFTQGATAGQLSVNLGWEPQYLLVKRTNSTGGYWYVTDIMRGLPAQSTTVFANDLSPNTADAEQVNNSLTFVSSTGFSYYTPANATYIYMAIRRGPMRTPTDGTKVFAMDFSASTTAQAQTPKIQFYSGWPVDFFMQLARTGQLNVTQSRLAGNNYLSTNSLNAEGAGYAQDVQSGVRAFTGTYSTNNLAYMFKRAPGFFDVVCWNGTGTYAARNHNLGVVPELVIQKCRNTADAWYVYTGTKYGTLNTTNAFANYSVALTSTSFVPVTDSGGTTHVTYLFASCPGVSKVGSYVGSETAVVQVNCGFTAGARFVLIKRTDTTGDWWVFDTARGIVAGNDAALRLNQTLAESSVDFVDPYSAGFELPPGTSVNTGGGTYIYLAIA